jgi:LacI family transcriptional regulator
MQRNYGEMSRSRAIEQQPKSSPGRIEMKKVLVLVETASGYGRGILKGIGQYVREHAPWDIYFEEGGLQERLPRSIERWQGHGILTRTMLPRSAKRLRSLHVPMVELLGEKADLPAKVHCDNAAVGRMAANHLLDCGLKNFGFFAFGEAWWIAMFRDGFRQVLAQRQLTCHVYKPPRANRVLLPKWRETQRKGVTDWLLALPRPVGIFTVSPAAASRLLDLSRGLGLTAPEEIAVVTATEDPTICDVTTPPLSSVDLNSAGVGYAAAAMLDRMMKGKPPPKHTLWLPPIRVTVRKSTEILALDDLDVVQAIRFIRQNACQGIGVPQVVDAVGLSRRVLERRCRQHLGRTPREEIMRVRIGQAQMLLSQTDMLIEKISQKCGFRDARNFARDFMREVKSTPRQYRNNLRRGHAET